MAKTRSKGTASADKTSATTTTATTSRYSLAEESGNPPQLFILPKSAAPESRVVTLKNPRYSTSTRYLACPETGIYEFVKIAGPASSPRSWFLENARGKLVEEATGTGTPGTGNTFDARIVQDADLFVASLIDPLFLALPALLVTCSSKPSEPPKRMFLSSDDHFDAISEPSNHLSEILRWPTMRKLLESRMSAVCDTVEAGDENMFRLNEGKLLAEIVSKAKKMSENGLPKSMEEKFVTKPLEAPFLASTGQYNASPPSNLPAPSAGSDGASTPQTESSELYSSVSSSESSGTESSDTSAATSMAVDSAPTTAEEVISVAITASEEVASLQRLKVAFNFICSSYISPSCARALNERLALQGGSVDFTPLDNYLAKLAKLRQEEVAVRSLTGFSRKRTLEEEDERAEKRRKKEEDEKRKKASESRGVRDLKKVNVKGMKKLSEFFKKK